MKQQIYDRWVRPILDHPRTTVSGFAAICSLFLPKYATQFAAAAAGIGLMLSQDAQVPEK